jgi:hypothetical protein
LKGFLDWDFIYICFIKNIDLKLITQDGFSVGVGISVLCIHYFEYE